MTVLEGNIVTENDVFHGRLYFQNSVITAIEKTGEMQNGTDWILAGFIDVHLHGLGIYDAWSRENIIGMAEFAPSKGTTRFCPAFSCAEKERLLDILTTVRDLVRNPPPGAKIIGSHLEGPWLNPANKGGMIEKMLRQPSIAEANDYLKASDGTLRLVTIAPELPGALDVIRLLNAADVRVSAGHTGCPPEKLTAAVDAGISQMCHLFDAYDLPADPGGVRHPALTDMALIDDRVMIEIIMDGLHVPPELIRLALRAAGPDRVIAITDALQGAGLPECRFCALGRWYRMKEGELGRLEDDNTIVGSSLTPNRAFFNMTKRFGFSPVEASKALSANPARAMGIASITGKLEPGLGVDITVMKPDSLSVKACYLEGKQIF